MVRNKFGNSIIGLTLMTVGVMLYLLTGNWQYLVLALFGFSYALIIGHLFFVIPLLGECLFVAVVNFSVLYAVSFFLSGPEVSRWTLMIASVGLVPVELSLWFLCEWLLKKWRLHKYPLHMAAIHGQVATVIEVINSGCNINALDHDGRTPLSYASEKGHLQIVETLLNSDNCKVNGLDDRGDRTALSYAAAEGHIEVVRALLAAGADPNLYLNERYSYRSPLHSACSDYVKSNEEIVKLLLDHGADPNAKDDLGKRPLFQSEWKKNAELLLDYGADIMARDNFGGTALHSCGKVELGKLLIANGADINARDKEGKTPLHAYIVRPENEDDVVGLPELLISSGADVNAKDNSGKTPLHARLCENPKEDVVRLLISSGADVNAKDNEGKRPLTLAIENRNNLYWEDIPEFLCKHGASK